MFMGEKSPSFTLGAYTFCEPDGAYYRQTIYEHVSMDLNRPSPKARKNKNIPIGTYLRYGYRFFNKTLAEITALKALRLQSIEFMPHNDYNIVMETLVEEVKEEMEDGLASRYTIDITVRTRYFYDLAAKMTITSPSGSTWVQSPTVAGQHELPIGVSDANLIAWWGMDGGACKDYSGNSIHGTVLTQTAAVDRHGRPASALYFSGANVAGITVPLVSTTKSYSFSMWVNAQSKDDLILFDSETNRLILMYRYNSVSRNKIILYDGNFKEFGVTPSFDEWNHLVFIADSSTSKCRLYLNGTQYGSELTYTGRNIGGVVKIGSRYASVWLDFKGSMDDFMIWDRVITEEEITALYQSLPDTTMYQYAITWVTNPLAPTDLVKIELYKAGVFHSTITASTVNDGSYTWIIDSALIPTGNDYQIRITALDGQYKYMNAYSDYLAIDKEYWTDENGDFVTDENGDPIPQN